MFCILIPTAGKEPLLVEAGNNGSTTFHTFYHSSYFRANSNTLVTFSHSLTIQQGGQLLKMKNYNRAHEKTLKGKNNNCAYNTKLTLTIGTITIKLSLHIISNYLYYM